MEKDMILLNKGHPSNDILPWEELTTAMTVFSKDDEHREYLNYGENAGSTEFRVILAKFLSKHYGIPVEYTSLLMTTGVSHGIDMVLSLLTTPGDMVIIEQPSYFLITDIFKHHGLRLTGIPFETDEKGIPRN